MDERDGRAKRFEEKRPHLRGVAYRMLGSMAEAEDAVQEAWLRLSRVDTDDVHNLGGWLTTVVARVCLDMLRSRGARSEEPLDRPAPRTIPSDDADPERDALLADSVGLAMLIVLDTLNPAERIAFVLHDMFDIPFDDIATIVGRSSDAARQLASRARRRVRGATALRDDDFTRRQQLVDAFLAASRAGDLTALLAVLDPDVVVRADAAAVRAGADAEVRGADAVAGTFAGRARAARPALVDGVPGLVWAPGGQPRVAFGFTTHEGRIIAIELIAEPMRLGELDIAIAGGAPESDSPSQ